MAWHDSYRSWNNGSRVVQLVNCIDIYMLMISNSVEYSSFSKRENPKVPLMICSSQTVRLVNHYFTTSTSRSTRKPLFHDPYESYESWTCIYTLSLSNDIHFTNCTTRKPLFHDPYDSWTIVSRPVRVLRLVNHCFTTPPSRTGDETMV